MGQLSMHNSNEPERVLVELGFDNMEPYTGPVATMEKTVPYQKPKMVLNDVVATSNTQKIAIGPSASDITMRTRNG